MKDDIIYFLVVLCTVASVLFFTQTIFANKVHTCSEEGGVLLKTPLGYECAKKSDICSM